MDLCVKDGFADCEDVYFSGHMDHYVDGTAPCIVVLVFVSFMGRRGCDALVTFVVLELAIIVMVRDLNAEWGLVILG